MVNVYVAVDALKDANASYANTQLEIVSVIAMVKEVNVIAMTMTMSERESDNLL